MRSSRLALMLLVILAIGGCGANAVIQQHNTEDSQSAADINAVSSAAEQQCAAEMKSPELDPIRDKVSIENAINPPVRFLVNNNKPTPKEAQALLTWASLREKCAGYERAAIASLPVPPDMDADIKERAKAGLNNVIDQAQRGGNYLIAALYEKRMTYGEFNKHRADLSQKILAEHAAYVATWVEQDKASTLQKAAVAQQQADATVAVLQAVASAACTSSKNRNVQALC
jgi:PBP1b-binding outer membrane lipoprotein LpoB